MAIYSLNHGTIGRTTHAAGTAGAHVGYITRASACRVVFGDHMPVPKAGTKGGSARAWLDEKEAGDRKNARVVDKLMLALPLELDGAQRVHVVRDFVRELASGKEVPFLAAIHDRAGTKDAANPHCHLVLRDRDPETGKGRVIGMSEKGSTDRAREIWEQVCNSALAKAGSEARIDRRTLKEQGIDRAPSGHEGPQPRQIDQKGRQSEILARIRARRRQDDEFRRKIEDKAQALLDARADLAKLSQELEEQRGHYTTIVSFIPASRDGLQKIVAVRKELRKLEERRDLIIRSLPKAETDLKQYQDRVASWHAEHKLQSALARMGRDRRPTDVQEKEDRDIPELIQRISSLKTALTNVVNAISKAKARISSLFARLSAHPEVKAGVDFQRRALKRAEELAALRPVEERSKSPAAPAKKPVESIPAPREYRPPEKSPELPQEPPEADSDDWMQGPGF